MLRNAKKLGKHRARAERTRWGNGRRGRLEWLEPRALLTANPYGLPYVADISIFANSASPNVDLMESVFEIDGKDGPNVVVGSGEYVSTGDGHDGDLRGNGSSSVVHLTSGEYHFRQVAPDSPGQELELKITGEVIIRTQFVFAPTLVFGDFSSGSPSLTVYAGQTLKLHFAGDTITDVVPVAHSFTADFMPDVEAQTTNTSIRGGDVTFMTTSGGDVNALIGAAGARGVAGGDGGRGGSITVTAHHYGVTADGARPPADVSGILSVNGGEGGESHTFSLDNPIHYPHLPGGHGGDAGDIVVVAAGLHANMGAIGGGGGLGAHGVEAYGDTTLDPALRDGLASGNGGNGGRANLFYETITSTILRFWGGDGGLFAGDGSSPGGFDAPVPIIRGGQGGNGGHGGAGGTFAFNETDTGARVVLSDIGGAAGQFAGDGAEGSHPRDSGPVIFVVAGSIAAASTSEGPGGNGGDSGRPGRSGTFRSEGESLLGIPVEDWTQPLLRSPGRGRGLGAVDGEYLTEPYGQHPNVNELSRPSAPPADEWTIMVYVGADAADIENQVMQTLDLFENVDLSRTGIRILVQVDRHPAGNLMPVPTRGGTDWADTRRGEVVFDGARGSYGTALTPVVLGPLDSELNTGDADALSQFIQWSVETAPAENYALIIAGHAAGWRGVAHDGSSLNSNGLQDRLTLFELSDAIVKADVKIDVLAFEACQIQTVELAAQLDPARVSYVMGPQSNTHALVLQHEKWLSRLVANPRLAPHDVAIAMVDAVGFAVPASVIDMSAIDSLLVSLSLFVNAALSLESIATQIGIAHAATSTPTFNGAHAHDHRDMGILFETFKSYLFDVPPLVSLADIVLANLHKTVLKQSTLGFGGLSIWYPTTVGDGAQLARYSPGAAAFNRLTHWDRLIAQRIPSDLLSNPENDIANDVSGAVALDDAEHLILSDLENSDDADWFSIEVEGPQELYVRLQVDRGSALSPVSVSVFAADGFTLLGQQTVDGGATDQTVMLTGAGRYYIVVTASTADVPGLRLISSELDSLDAYYSLFVLHGTAGTLNPIAVAPGDPISFGTILAGEIASGIVEVSNHGRLPLNIISASIVRGEDRYVIDLIEPLDEAIDFGSSILIPITFTAPSAGDYLGVLRLTTNDPAAPTLEIPLSGTVQGTPKATLFADDYIMNIAPGIATAAEGLFANDINALSAPQVISQPAFGTLELNADGTFRYTPGPDFWGIDRFRYATTNTAEGEAAEVLLMSHTAAVVRKLYGQVLGRDPDDGGWKHWTIQVNAGAATLGVIASSIFESNERLDPIIQQYYRDYLLREVDAGGLAYWRDLVWKADGGQERVIAGVVASDEFFASAGGTTEGWVREMYRRLLKREPDAGGFAYWVGQLDSGLLNRDGVVLKFLRSDENFRNLVIGWHTTYLNREPTSVELSDSVAKLRAGASHRDIQIAILNGVEYRNTPTRPAAGVAERVG